VEADSGEEPVRIILKDGMRLPQMWDVPDGTKEWKTREAFPGSIQRSKTPQQVQFFDTRWVPSGTMDARTGAVVFVPEYLLEKRDDDYVRN
jgi:hypothetical protein